jgi:hypothetical protein
VAAIRRTKLKKIVNSRAHGAFENEKKAEVLKTILVLISGIALGARYGGAFYAMPGRSPNVYDPYGNRWRRKTVLPTLPDFSRTIHYGG